MRKLLLASAAALGASVGTMGFASAQTTNLPPAVLEGIPAAPQSVPGANNNNNYQAAMLPPGPTQNPTPGSIVVRVNARVVFYVAGESSSLDKTNGVGAANTGAAKLDPLSTQGYMRLYFGMDGMATNGLRYGGAIEIRQNTGAATASTANNQSSANSTASTLYVRRAFGYVAAGNAGIFRFGQADGPFGIFDNGITTSQGFDDGGWNGDLPAAIPGNAEPQFPFLTQQGAEYTSSKLVYLSPQLAGFDFGLSWAPDPYALQNSSCAIAATGCVTLSSTSTPTVATATGGLTTGFNAAVLNQYEAALRYQSTFGPLGVLAYGGYMGSGNVSYQGPAEVGGFPAITFRPLSIGVGGVALTYGPITVAGNVQGGTTNGIGAAAPSGAPHAIAWIGGVTYSSGPFTIGTSYYAYDSQGAVQLTGISQRHETGYAAGMTYGVAPGLVLWVSYLYGTRHQGDFNFQTSTIGTAYNNVKGQAFAVGTMVKW